MSDRMEAGRAALDEAASSLRWLLNTRKLPGVTRATVERAVELIASASQPRASRTHLAHCPAHPHIAHCICDSEES